MAKKWGTVKKKPWRRLDGSNKNTLMPLIAAVLAVFCIGGLYTYLESRPGGLKEVGPGESLAGTLSRFRVKPPGGEEASLAALAGIRAAGLIIDVHEHIESIKMAPLYLEVMDELGIRTMCLMGSPKFTLTMNESYGFTGYDENNETLLEIVQAYPGRFEAWPTLSPTDPENLNKLKSLIARGATGVKLYNGHGYVTRKKEFMFHPVAMDDPKMLPVYAYCEENFILHARQSL